MTIGELKIIGPKNAKRLAEFLEHHDWIVYEVDLRCKDCNEKFWHEGYKYCPHCGKKLDRSHKKEKSQINAFLVTALEYSLNPEMSLKETDDYVY